LALYKFIGLLTYLLKMILGLCTPTVAVDD